MLTLSDILKPRHVDLNLAFRDRNEAIEALTELLQGDARVSSWTGFHDALMHNAQRGITHLSCGAGICHARTDCVEAMVMAAGIFPRGQEPASDVGAGELPPMRYLFVIGIPPAMAADYLRVVGALARSLKNPMALAALDVAESGEDFVDTLSRQELAI